jgi:hypothetical protein
VFGRGGNAADTASGTAANAPPASDPRDQGSLLVPVGIGVTLVGLLGDLVVHAMNPAGHAHEELIVIGHGANPWHLVLFFGIVLTAVGGIHWVSHFRSEGAALFAAWLSLLLLATVATGAWVAWQGTRRAQRVVTASAHAHVAAASPEAAAAAGAAESVEGVSEFGGHSHGTAGPTTPEEAKILKDQLADARTASAKYKDVSVAKADGYIQVTQFIPGLGLHMVDLGISQTTFDPRRPQVLLYEPAGTGESLRLAGIGYALQTGGVDPPEGFAGGSDVWHFHRHLCFLPNGSVTIAPSAGDCQEKSGIFQARTAWLLHVWLWTENPNGIFTEVNPQVF